MDPAIVRLDAPFHCRECGRTLALRDHDHPAHYTGASRAAMARHGTCFVCEHWRQIAGICHENRSVRIEGKHFTLGEEPPSQDAWKRVRRSLGLGGESVVIRFTDAAVRPGGRAEPVVVTHNLWAQGEIPPHFRERLPDNAVVVTRSSGYIEPTAVREYLQRG